MASDSNHLDSDSDSRKIEWIGFFWIRIPAAQIQICIWDARIFAHHWIECIQLHSCLPIKFHDFSLVPMTNAIVLFFVIEIISCWDHNNFCPNLGIHWCQKYTLSQQQSSLKTLNLSFQFGRFWWLYDNSVFFPGFDYEQRYRNTPKETYMYMYDIQLITNS